MAEPLRIQKYLSEQGIMSRREAEAALSRGLISVNGKVTKELGTKIDPDVDTVTVAGMKNPSQKKTTVAVYKPRGYTSTRSEEKSMFEVFPIFKGLNAVGRLDKESEGLILLSDDGMITKAITGDQHLTEKEYIVTARENIMPWMIEKMEQGIKLADGMTLPAIAKRINRHTFRITIKEGRNHQIRRMADALHLTVSSLLRVRIGPVKLASLRPGQFRKLNPAEIDNIKSVIN